jgi:hypothetical protein
LNYPCKVLVEFLEEIYLVQVDNKQELYENIRQAVNKGLWPDECSTPEMVKKEAKVLGYFSVETELLKWVH